MNDTMEMLRQSAIFCGLTADELTEVRSGLHTRHYAVGSVIMEDNQPGETAYIIFSGAVRITARDDQGREVILAILGAGEIVGEMSLIDSLGRSATAVTHEDSVIGWVAYSRFREWINSMPALSKSLNAILSRRIRMANGQIRWLATLDVRGRLAALLLTFAEEYGVARETGVTIGLRLTQSDLACMVGATRVRVNQVLAPWKKARVISAAPDHKITVLNAESLKRFV